MNLTVGDGALAVRLNTAVAGNEHITVGDAAPVPPGMPSPALTINGLVGNPLEKEEKKVADAKTPAADVLADAIAFVCQKAGKPVPDADRPRLRASAVELSRRGA